MAVLKVGDVVQITGSAGMSTDWIGLKATIKGVYPSSYMLAPHTDRPDGHKLIEFLWAKKLVELVKPEPAPEEFKVGDILVITKSSIDDSWLGLECEVLPQPKEATMGEVNIWVKPLQKRPFGGFGSFWWPRTSLELKSETSVKSDHDLLEEIAVIIHSGGAGLLRLAKIDKLLKEAGIEVKS